MTHICQGVPSPHVHLQNKVLSMPLEQPNPTRSSFLSPLALLKSVLTQISPYFSQPESCTSPNTAVPWPLGDDRGTGVLLFSSRPKASQESIQTGPLGWLSDRSLQERLHLSLSHARASSRIPPSRGNLSTCSPAMEASHSQECVYHVCHKLNS